MGSSAARRQAGRQSSRAQANPSGATIPATGKKVTVPDSSTLEIKGGKLTHNWIFWDRATFLGQLGLMPPCKRALR